MGEENNPLWGTATIFINGEKLGTLENVSKTITMEQKQFNEGDKVLLNGNTENIYVISKVIHNYRGNGGCRYHLRKENEEYGSNLSFVRGSKLSAYEEQKPKFKVGDWMRNVISGKVFRIRAMRYTGWSKEWVLSSDVDALEYWGSDCEPYSPKEGEFYYVKGNYSEEYIVCNEYMCNLKEGVNVAHSTTFGSFDKKLHTRRPAKDYEKDQLMYSVQHCFSKTYCEKTKEWVDVKKGLSREDLDRVAEKMKELERDVAKSINRLSLEGVLGNRPDHEIAELMVFNYARSIDSQVKEKDEIPYSKIKEAERKMEDEVKEYMKKCNNPFPYYTPDNIGKHFSNCYDGCDRVCVVLNDTHGETFAYTPDTITFDPDNENYKFDCGRYTHPIPTNVVKIRVVAFYKDKSTDETYSIANGDVLPTEPEKKGTMPFFTNVGLGRIDLTELQQIADLAGWKPSNVERFRQIAEANKEVIELLVKVGVLQDPTNPSDVYSYNVGKSDYAKKSPIQPWMMWQLWDWLTPWDCDIIKRLYRDKEGTSRIEDYNKIIHICKERIRQLNEEK